MLCATFLWPFFCLKKVPIRYRPNAGSSISGTAGMPCLVMMEKGIHVASFPGLPRFYSLVCIQFSTVKALIKVPLKNDYNPQRSLAH